MRHIRRCEPACPFCGGALSTPPAPAPSREPFRRMAAAAAVATLTGCSSGGSAIAPYGSPPFTGVDATDFSGNSAITCRTSAGCLPGQVCCGALNLTTSCQAGPCPPTPFGQLQVCGISAECLTAGDTCGTRRPPIPPVGVMICDAPGDGGVSGEGGEVEGGSSSDADEGGELVTDAPSGG